MNDHGRHIAVLGIAVIVIAMGGAVAIVAALMKAADQQLYMVALGIVGAGSSIVAAEFGLARSSPSSGPTLKLNDHPVTINAQEPRVER